MISQEIRRNFLSYFKERGHSIIASSSVVPHDDPTLLFTNAGMNQFKDVFLGRSERDYKRASTSQKCIRVGGKHNDLDNVGHTTRHLTFFEMLGNFSFGDYFKKEAIQFAWEISTQVFGFEPSKIWVTVFESDDEAYDMWKEIVPESRIVRMGEKDNFWAMGDTGPCGPCSELLYDRGEKYGPASSPKEDTTGERYLEFWNLVFMQFNRDASGKMTPLPKQSIDTGAGLERVISLKMGVDTVFATDIFQGLIKKIEEVSGKSYNAHDEKLAPAFHVIADHIRSLSFAIADGAQPSNVERGYVLRKILRRAVRYGRMLGMQEPFLAKVLPRLIEIMGPDYPELKASQVRIAEILTTEEEAFLRTLKRGGNILQQVIEKAQASHDKQISGEEAFKLKDTYGFPLEEILLLAKDTAVSVDLDAFEQLEKEARQKSKSARIGQSQQAESSLFQNFTTAHGRCSFVGYHSTEAEGSVLALVHEGEFVEALKEGQEGLVILDKTPFYAEKGGQVADVGILTHNDAHFEVDGCYSPYNDVIVHKGKLDKGALILGEPVRAFVSADRRKKIANNHTATHLLHYALEKVLGSHIKQAGSLVEEGRLRFDFNHHKPLSSEELIHIEKIVNEKIRENLKVSDYELSYEEAQKRNDIKQFFGEKYGSKVRVVDIDISKELCGGTHTDHIGSIGLFRILKESSISAGVRRIEAVTGSEAEQLMYANLHLVDDMCALLKTTTHQVKDRLSLLIEEHKLMSSQLKAHRRASVRHLASELMQKAEKIGAYDFICDVVAVEQEDMQQLLEDLGSLSKTFVAALATKTTDRCQLFVKVAAEPLRHGVHAGNIIKEIASFIGGKGGGKADSAQAGGTTPAGLAEAFDAAKKIVRDMC